MYFKQLVKEDLGCASYVVGCLDAAVCAVVDPRLDMVDNILELVATKGMRVIAVIETHTPLKDGDGRGCGVVKLRVIHTPGHRQEHIALAVSDTSRSDDPWLVLTGDSLFIGDVARPDLAVICASGQRSTIASALLQRHGFTAVANVVGGMEAWNKVAWKQAERVGDKVKAVT